MTRELVLLDPRLLDRWCKIASGRRHQPRPLTTRDMVRVAGESGIPLDVLIDHARSRGWPIDGQL